MFMPEEYYVYTCGILSLSLQNVKFMPAERRILHASQIIHHLLKIDIFKVETVATLDNSSNVRFMGFILDLYNLQ